MNKHLHPSGIYPLFFTEMWERFSYYGMRALLVLYMTAQTQNGGMGFTDEVAAAVYGLYTALVYLAAFPGGWMGDRLLGARESVWWGGVTIALGHGVLGLDHPKAFFVGLVLVALGSGLLKSNMSVLVGQLYPEGGERRDAGFTLFYMGINLGALFGQLGCGWLGETIGWRWGFSAAAVGMLLGLVQFKSSRRHLAHIGGRQEHAGQNLKREWSVFWGAMGFITVLTTLCVMGVLPFDAPLLAQWTAWIIAGVALLYFLWAFLLAGLSSAERGRLLVIAVLFCVSALFWAGFEQVGSSFSLFAQRYTLRRLGDWEVPASWIQALNPLCVIVLAPIVAGLWTRLAACGKAPLLTTKVAWSLLMLALGFAVAAWAAHRALHFGPVWPSWLMTVVVLHTLGELFISPVGLSAVTKLSPPRLTGQMMGVWFLGSSLGNILAGLLAGQVAGEAAAEMPARFMDVVLTSSVTGVLLLMLAPRIAKLMPGIR